jgi:hypothetical protein
MLTDLFARSWRCYLFLLLSSLLYFLPLWTHPNELIYSRHSDILSVHYPWRVFAVQSWRSTHTLPLWSPYACCGQPFQADLQSTLFYPPHLVFYLVPVSWVAPLFGVLIWCHVLLAGCGMFAYARQSGLERFPGLLAALGVMFAGKWLLHVLQAGHYIFVPLAWFPLLLLCVERAAERRQWTYAVAAGVLTAMIFTGSHPQLMLYSVYVGGLLSLRPLLESGNSRLMGLGWWLATWTIAGLTGAVLAAVQWLPALELAGLTTRVHVITPEFGQGYDLIFHGARGFAKRLLSLAGPQNFGGNPWETVGAFGLVWCGVALLALVLCRRRIVWFYGGALLLLILCAFHSSTPVYGLLQRTLPGMALFRHPTRLLLFAGFPLGMMAGYLSQHLFVLQPLPRWALYGASGFLVLLSVLYLAGSRLAHMPWQSYGIYAPTLNFMLAGLVLWQIRRPRSTQWVALAWLLVLVTDLWALHARFVRTRPVEQIYPENDAIRFLAQRPSRSRVLDRAPVGQPASVSPLTQPLCYLHEVESLRGLNPTDLYAYKQFLNYAADTSEPPELGEIPQIGTIRNQQLLDLLAVRYLLNPADLPLASEEADAWQPVQILRDNRVHLEVDSMGGGISPLPPYVVYERKAMLPRAFVVAEARAMPGQADLLSALRCHDLKRLVFLDSPGGLLESRTEPVLGRNPGPAFQEAVIVAEEPNKVTVEVTRQQPGYLVLLDVWYPGWTCRDVDGQKLPVWRADSLLRAVRIEAGHHRLEFVFDPILYRLGRGVSMFALTALTLFVSWQLCRLARDKFKRRATANAAGGGRDTSTPVAA